MPSTGTGMRMRTGAWGAHKQDALGQLAAQLREAVRVAQVVHHLLQLCLQPHSP